MQRIFWLIALLTFTVAAHAQMPPGGTPPPGGTLPPGVFPGGGKPAANGHLYGKVLDSDGKPLPYTSVIVFQNRYDSASGTKKDVLVKGAMTQNNGDFSLEGVPTFGPLILKISATGFKQFVQTVSFKKAGGGAPSTDKDLGNIKLSSDISQLNEVTVTATKPLMKVDMDKKVFDVTQNIASVGGTAQDVMKNVPSVNVDVDGNMTMRNATPQLYLDGRPTTLTLDQIPADAIETVEVMTAPSAKYDASGGGAGIVNIVLKKNRKTGYNGNIRAGVDSRGGLNGGLDFNARQGKFNLSANAMYHQNKDRVTGYTDRTDFSTTPNLATLQNNVSTTNGGFMFGRVGLDYFMNNRTTLSLTGTKVHGEMKPGSTLDIYTDSLYDSGTTSSYGHRITEGKRVFNGNGLELAMKHLFPHEGDELSITANYFGGTNKNNSLYTTNYYTAKGGTYTDDEIQKINGDGKMSHVTAQADYVKQLTTKSKLEAGVRGQFNYTLNKNATYYYNDETGQYDLSSSSTSNYENHENILAAYGSFSSSIKNFSYKLGLRAESSNYDGKLLNNGEKFSNSYPVSLFPTIFLSQKLGNNQELQLSVTRRINRPSFFQLIPFADSTDKLNITKGNPALVPEFTQSYELSYMKTFKDNSTFMASAYYKRTTNTITSYIDSETDETTGSTALINTYINAKNSYTTGAEITLINYFTKWWDMSTNINTYNSKVNAGTSEVQNNALWSVFAKVNSNFKLPANFDVQLTGTYQSKTNLPVNQQKGFGDGPPQMQAQSSSQGYIKGFYGIDLAVKKSFLKSKALTATVSVSDIFRSRITDQVSYSTYFTQEYTRLRNPQMLKLNLAYRFGKIDASLFKRKANSSMDTNSGMQM